MANDTSADPGSDRLARSRDPVARSYDAVAAAYDARFDDEMTRKVLDRALLGALLELAGPGVVADVGCGSGQITRFLSERHEPVVGLDLSTRMVERARVNAPRATCSVASMTDLPVADQTWSGVAAMYSVVNLTPQQRRAAYGEFARVLRPGGWLLLAFHIDGDGGEMGGERHLSHWLDQDVDLTFYYLDPQAEADAVAAAGFEVRSSTLRQPIPDAEAPTRRCYLLAQRA